MSLIACIAFFSFVMPCVVRLNVVLPSVAAPPKCMKGSVVGSGGGWGCCCCGAEFGGGEIEIKILCQRHKTFSS